MTVHVKTFAALAVSTFATGCLAPPVATESNAPPVLERTIPLTGLRGRIDHLAIDLRRQRVFVAELGNGSVEAIDLAGGVSLGRVAGLKEPQGLADLPARDEFAVAGGRDGSVRFYRARDLSPTGTANVGSDADKMRVDTSGRVVVGYGSGALAVIDAASRKLIAGLRLPAHPENFRLTGDTVFVNLPNVARIVVGDLANGKILASWPAKYGFGFPRTLGAENANLAVVHRMPPRLQLIDAANGMAKLDHATCGDADDVFFDEARGRAYVICGSGEIDVVELARPDRSRRIRTRSGARTGLYVPELNRLLVAAGATAEEGAGIMVYRPQP